jgi:hypothetical protein
MKSTNLYRIFFLAVSSICFAGCGSATGDTAESNNHETEAVSNEDIGTAEQAITNGWTPYTSEEYAPIGCDSGSLMNRVQCSGSYCDNIRAYCVPTGGSLGISEWTPYFSEEGTNKQTCPVGYWVTGLDCLGEYCDSVSLECTQINGISAKDCHWTGSVSEENGGTLNFGSNYYMRGAECSGSFCDNLRFYICQK